MKRATLRRIGLGILAGLVLYLLAWPNQVDPAPWDLSPAPAHAINDRLASVTRIAVGGAGPEAIAIAEDGTIYTGLDDGRIVRITADETVTTFADTGGRPLGLEIHPTLHLVVADAFRGLLAVDDDGKVTVLADAYDGRPLVFADDVGVAPDGTVYFSEASSKYGLHDTVLDIIEHRPHGRLFAYDPSTGATRLVIDALYFANGVAVAPDGAFVLVAETGMHRVLRHVLTGPRAGTTEVFVDALPGMPDNVTIGPTGTVWIALVAVRSAQQDVLARRPFLRKVVSRLPRVLLPTADRHAFVLGISPDGTIVHDLQDASSDSFAPITSAREHGGVLWLGSLYRDAIAHRPVPAAG